MTHSMSICHEPGRGGRHSSPERDVSVGRIVFDGTGWLHMNEEERNFMNESM